MSLYGYDLALFVVEASPSIPIGRAGKLWKQTVGMFGEAAMVELWDGVGKTMMAGPHKAQEGASGWVRGSHRQWNLSGYVIS
jgi:hypothetical protein